MQPDAINNPGDCRWRTLGRHCRQVVPRLRTVLMLTAVVLTLAKLVGTSPEWLLQGTDSVVTLITACVIYALLLAIPFIPSVEIGLLIMVLFGAPGAAGAYLATCTGLTGAYLIGRRLGGTAPFRRINLPPRYSARLSAITARLPAGMLPVLSLAALLNMPGNTAVGGGGGIAMAYGAGRLLTAPAFLTTVALATAILPIAFVTGLVGLERWVKT